MKRSLVLLLIFCSASLFAQEADRFTKNDGDSQRDPRMNQYSYVHNEVLVKFKDNVQVNVGTNLKSAGISSVDKVLNSLAIESVQKLFPEELNLKSLKNVKDPQGRDMVIPSLHNIYKISLPQSKAQESLPLDVKEVIKELKSLPEVEYAEPNYTYIVDNLNSVVPEVSADDLSSHQGDVHKSIGAAVIPNDPLYGQQGYISAIKADLIWEQTTGDTSQVIAILDTGVDWNHPDLKNKIWRNQGEIPANGIDDDGNGLIDDIMGWDYIHNDNNPMDDNSHGTHVAGIAAAEGNNGIGIAGVNWKAKILPVKVFQSSGRGDISTISQGITYAANNGAAVINMSFGGYYYSKTMEDVLKNAFAKGCYLVAAAGNDSYSIYDIDILGNSMTFFPAAFSFVLGVQAPEGFSNYDPDGPVFSEFFQGLNYEIIAPGTAMSTVLNGNYRSLQGTSMAAPIISGAITLYKSIYPDKTLEELWSDFIHSSKSLFDINEAMFGENKKPVLDITKYLVEDLCQECDLDNHSDAGEVVDVKIQVRNTGTPAERVYAKMSLNIGSSPDDITILKDSSFLGNVGVYRTINNENDPFKVKINENCYNDRIVLLDIQLYNASNEEIFTNTVKIQIYNGEELSGILLHDTILTPDKNWVITNSLRIATGVTVTILPGTKVQIVQGVDNRGKLIAIGTEENRISMTGAIGGDAIYKYADIDLLEGGISSNKLEYCNIYNASSIQAKNISYSRIENFNNLNNNGYYSFNIDTIYRSFIVNSLIYPPSVTLKIAESVFENFMLGIYYFDYFSGLTLELNYNVFNKMNNIVYRLEPFLYDTYKEELATYFFRNYSGGSGIIKNSFLENEYNTFFLNTSGADDYVSLLNQYWGSTDPEKIRKKYKDFLNNSGTPYFQYEPNLDCPSDSCHGHVWKVLVNGKDAQDEVVEPLGVGKHKFDIYFNRPMKKNVIPQISFGGLYPYTSIQINEDGSWSEDGKIYTVYKTLDLTNADGINQIRVEGAIQNADWGWEIPLEDSRFSFIINAAGSASLEFQATPGLGKVALEWNNNNLEDGMGYNMYRMEQINDSTLAQPVLINNTLITDTLYTDFSVIPNKKYFYYYKILRTNFSETDSSRVVSATPFTASKGDANGDLAVNVLDVTSIVAYMLNNNPQPFIFEAADVNSDVAINVLDIVGAVNIILNDVDKSGFVQGDQTVELYVQGDTLFANSPLNLSGLQFEIKGISNINELEILSALKNFEQGHAVNENSLMIFFYSMSGKMIKAGDRIPLIKLKKGSGIVDMILADKGGNQVTVEINETTSVWNLADNLKEGVAVLGHNYPNPYTNLTNIPFVINEPVDEAIIRVFNIQGFELFRKVITNVKPGEYEVEWNGTGRQGIYFYILEIQRGSSRVVCGKAKMMGK